MPYCRSTCCILSRSTLTYAVCASGFSTRSSNLAFDLVPGKMLVDTNASDYQKSRMLRQVRVMVVL